MRFVQSRRERLLVVLMNRSVEFVKELFFRATNLSQFPSPSLSLQSSSLFSRVSGRACVKSEKQLSWLDEFVASAAAAHCLAAAGTHEAELRASLVAAFFLKPHWNNSVTHVVDGQTLASIEKNVTDNAAVLFGLPRKFFWSQKEENKGWQGKLVNSLALQPVTHCKKTLRSQVYMQSVSTRGNNSNFNSDSGGGLLHCSSLESLVVLLSTARAQAYARYISASFSSPEDEARVARRLVLYCSDQCQPLLKRAARCVGIQHIRTLQTVFSPIVHNYSMHMNMLKSAVAEDAASGFYPFFVCGVFGSRNTGAVDPLDELAEFCSMLKLWFHIDASHSGLALAATCFQDLETEHFLLPGFIYEKDSAFDKMWDQLHLSFRKAALHADSIHFGLSTSFLPTLSVNSPASLLYVADVAKVSIAMRQISRDDEGGNNVWCTPKMTDISLMRLHNPEMRSNEILRLAIILNQYNCTHIGYVVRKHQRVSYLLAKRLRADGRFDCSVESSFFGMVLFRWLTLADEETETLLWRWTNTYATLYATDGNNCNLPRASLGLTKIQRRTYICVALLVNYECDESGFLDDTGDGALLDGSCVEVLMKSLQEAAWEWDNKLLPSTSGDGKSEIASKAAMNEK